MLRGPTRGPFCFVSLRETAINGCGDDGRDAPAPVPYTRNYLYTRHCFDTRRNWFASRRWYRDCPGPGSGNWRLDRTARNNRAQRPLAALAKGSPARLPREPRRLTTRISWRCLLSLSCDAAKVVRAPRTRQLSFCNVGRRGHHIFTTVANKKPSFSSRHSYHNARRPTMAAKPVPDG